jgi:bacterioferritin-associated ferredoxin
MYICICSETTEQQIIDCANDGCTFKEMINNLKCCQQCGTCSFYVKDLYDGQKRKQNGVNVNAY